MINISEKAISPDKVIAKAKRNSSGCVVTYVGLIREISFGKPVLSVEYIDVKGDAKTKLSEIADEARQKWNVDNIAISHRIGKLNVGDINLVVAVAAAHRSEGFGACQYIIDQFKQRLPTNKIETYNDHTTHTG
jgi:molybdopterin synthase catalytic subunit